MSNRSRRRTGSTNATGREGILSSRRRRRAQSSATTTLPDDQCLQFMLDVRHLMSGEWVWDVVLALYQQPAQYTELLTSIQENSTDGDWPGRKHRRLQDSTLHRTLRRLEQGELVERQREEAFPYHTTYRLTDPAKELVSSAAPLAQWAERHQEMVSRVRRRRHAENNASG